MRTLAIAAAFGGSALGSAAFALVYVLGGQPQLEGVTLALALAGLGLGLGLWGTAITPHEPAEEEWEPPSAPHEEREAFRDDLVLPEGVATRRGFLLAALAAALGALATAALFPLRSFGRGPGRELFHTSWRAGSRLVRETGEPVRLGDLEPGSVLTVWPEEAVGAADSQTLLIRLETGRYRGPSGWDERDHVAFSRVCTHAGCPVGLYQPELHQLLCPCHQAVFDVLDGCRPIFGPAPRPLPQLPLEADGDGFLRAQDDYAEPVGPSTWDRGRAS